MDSLLQVSVQLGNSHISLVAWPSLKVRGLAQRLIATCGLNMDPDTVELQMDRYLLPSASTLGACLSRWHRPNGTESVVRIKCLAQRSLEVRGRAKVRSRADPRGSPQHTVRQVASRAMAAMAMPPGPARLAAEAEAAAELCLLPYTFTNWTDAWEVALMQTAVRLARDLLYDKPAAAASVLQAASDLLDVPAALAPRGELYAGLCALQLHTCLLAVSYTSTSGGGGGTGPPAAEPASDEHEKQPAGGGAARRAGRGRCRCSSGGSSSGTGSNSRTGSSARVREARQRQVALAAEQRLLDKAAGRVGRVLEQVSSYGSELTGLLDSYVPPPAPSPSPGPPLRQQGHEQPPQGPAAAGTGAGAGGDGSRRAGEVAEGGGEGIRAAAVAVAAVAEGSPAAGWRDLRVQAAEALEPYAALQMLEAFGRLVGLGGPNAAPAPVLMPPGTLPTGTAWDCHRSLFHAILDLCGQAGLPRGSWDSGAGGGGGRESEAAAGYRGGWGLAPGATSDSAAAGPAAAGADAAAVPALELPLVARTLDALLQLHAQAHAGCGGGAAGGVAAGASGGGGGGGGAGDRGGRYGGDSDSDSESDGDSGDRGRARGCPRSPTFSQLPPCLDWLQDVTAVLEAACDVYSLAGGSDTDVEAEGEAEGGLAVGPTMTFTGGAAAVVPVSQQPPTASSSSSSAATSSSAAAAAATLPIAAAASAAVAAAAVAAAASAAAGAASPPLMPATPARGSAAGSGALTPSGTAGAVGDAAAGTSPSRRDSASGVGVDPASPAPISPSGSAPVAPPTSAAGPAAAGTSSQQEVDWEATAAAASGGCCATAGAGAGAGEGESLPACAASPSVLAATAAAAMVALAAAAAATTGKPHDTRLAGDGGTAHMGVTAAAAVTAASPAAPATPPPVAPVAKAGGAAAGPPGAPSAAAAAGGGGGSGGGAAAAAAFAAAAVSAASPGLSTRVLVLDSLLRAFQCPCLVEQLLAGGARSGELCERAVWRHPRLAGCAPAAAYQKQVLDNLLTPLSYVYEDDDYDAPVLQVCRSDLLGTSMAELMQYDAYSLGCEGICISFEDEQAFGDGVLREWLTEVASAVFDPNAGLFRLCEGDVRALHLSPAGSQQDNHLELLTFAGRIMGLAMRARVPLGFHLSSALFKLLQHPGRAGRARLGMGDLAQLEPLVAATCGHIAAEQDVEALGLTFVASCGHLGLAREVPLLAGGRGEDVAVTAANRRDYLERLVRFYCTWGASTEHGAAAREDGGGGGGGGGGCDWDECPLDAVEALAQGLADALVFADEDGVEAVAERLRPVSAAAFNSRLGGETGRMEVADWRGRASAQAFKSEREKAALEAFWGVVEELSAEEQRRLLQFWTGISHLPAGGFKNLSQQLQLVPARQDGEGDQDHEHEHGHGHSHEREGGVDGGASGSGSHGAGGGSSDGSRSSVADGASGGSRDGGGVGSDGAAQGPSGGPGSGADLDGGEGDGADSSGGNGGGGGDGGVGDGDGGNGGPSGGARAEEAAGGRPNTNTGPLLLSAHTCFFQLRLPLLTDPRDMRAAVAESLANLGSFWNE